MIVLCVKCYCVDEEDRENKKFRRKGMSKRQNITWQHFKVALNGSIDRVQNREFCTVCTGGAKRMTTCEQQKLGLSAYYDKCWVLLNGIHTEPIKFHTT